MYLYVYFFVIILILAFDYFREEADAFLLEIAKTSNNYLKNDFMHFIVMFQWIICSYVIMVSFASVSYKISGTLTGEVFVYLLKLNLLCIVLNGTCAILLGWLIARVVSKIIGYVCIIFVACLVSPIFTSQVGYLSMVFNEIYENVRAVIIMPEGIEGRNIFTLFPINMTIIARITFWIFLILCGLVLYYKSKKKIIFLSLCLMGVGLSIVEMDRPASFYSSNNTYSVNDSVFYDQMTYMIGNAEQKQQAAEYKVTSYKMNFEMKQQMKAEVTMSFDNGTLDEYPMTLYHLYQVNSVVDQTGQPLEYNRQGDYLTIQKGTSDLQTVTLTYFGGCANFYSNREAINLPGWFAYYPIPGYCEIYNDYTYIDNRLNYLVQFDVNVEAEAEVFSDIKREQGNHFLGEGYGISLISGFVTEKTLDNGIRCIYPYLDKMYDPMAEITQEDVKAVLPEIENKTVFFIPNLAGDTVTSIREDSIITSGVWRDIKNSLSNDNVVVTEEETIDNFITGYYFYKESDPDSMTYDYVRDCFNLTMSDWDAENYSDKEFEQFIIDNLGEKELEFIKSR